MTTYRLMDGASGRPGTGSSVLTPPGSPASYSGNFQAGQFFCVTQPGLWFQGYWWYVPAGGDTTAQEFCLYAHKGGTTGSSAALIPGTTVTAGTLTAGAFNYIPLTTPIQLSIGSAGANGGGQFIAMTAWTAVHGFPDSANQLGTGNNYPNGITNGPLTAYGASNNLSTYSAGVSSVFGTGSNDPTTGAVYSVSGTGDLFWLDIQVTDAAPAGYAGSYRIWPNRGDKNVVSGGDQPVNYVVATEIHLNQQCVLNRAWYYSPASSTQLATRTGVYSITGASAGTEAAAITSPSWSGAAGSGWVSADFAASTILNAGNYKVYVYNNAASPVSWSSKDATSDYWQTGEGASGISWGPLTATQLSASSQAYQYDSAGGSNTPPYSDGTSTTVRGQPTFAINGAGGSPTAPAAQYPYLWAPVGPSTNQTQNYWVDLEVTPTSQSGTATFTGTGTLTAAGSSQGGTSAALNSAGTLTAMVTQRATATITGAGRLVQGSGFAIAWSESTVTDPREGTPSIS